MDINALGVASEPEPKRARMSGTDVDVCGNSKAPAAAAAKSTETAAAGEDGVPFASVPRELLSHVFGLLDVTERSRASRVCRRWRAVALEPPHSTSLSIRLLHEWALDGTVSVSQWLREPEAWAPDPTALTEAESLLALRSPLAAGVRRLRIAFGRAAGPPPSPELEVESGEEANVIRRWPLRAVLEALPSSVTSLEIVYTETGSSGVYFEEAREVFQQLDRLQELAPQLRALKLCNFRVDDWAPRHTGLERLDVGVPGLELDVRDLWGGRGDEAPGLPSVKQLARVNLSCPYWMSVDDQLRHLSELAMRGLRVHSLALKNFNLREAGVVEALHAIFQPRADGFGGPSELSIYGGNASAGLPESFAADAERICIENEVHQGLLPWLQAVSRGPSLRELSICDRYEQGHAVGPRELLGALQGCRKGLRVQLDWPAADVTNDPAWSDDGLAEACELIMRDPSLVMAVAVCPHFTFWERSTPSSAAHAALYRCCAEHFIVRGKHDELNDEEKDEAEDLLLNRLSGMLGGAIMAQGRDLTDAEKARAAFYDDLFVRMCTHVPMKDRSAYETLRTHTSHTDWSRLGMDAKVRSILGEEVW